MAGRAVLRRRRWRQQSEGVRVLSHPRRRCGEQGEGEREQHGGRRAGRTRRIKYLYEEVLTLLAGGNIEADCPGILGACGWRKFCQLGGQDGETPDNAHHTPARPVWCQPRDYRDRRHPRMIHPRRARAAAAPLAYFLRLRFTETPARTGATPSEIYRRVPRSAWDSTKVDQLFKRRCCPPSRAVLRGGRSGRTRSSHARRRHVDRCCGSTRRCRRLALRRLSSSPSKATEEPSQSLTLTDRLAGLVRRHCRPITRAKIASVGLRVCLLARCRP